MNLRRLNDYYLVDKGEALSMSDIAGFVIEDIVALGAQIAIDNAIENGTPIDIVDLVNQHNEWQLLLI